MIPGFILGVLGGIATAKMVGCLHGRLRAGGCHGGGCHGGFGRFGGFGGFGRRGGHMVYWISRQLDLDARQQAEVETLLSRVRGSFGGLRAGRVEGLGAVLEAFGPDSFDRTRVEAAAAKQGEAFTGVKKEVIDALARLHEILTPGQRERLRAMAGRFYSRF